MDNVLNISPGLIFWTLINFGIFLFILLKFGYKPMKDSLTARENSIADAIANAEKASSESQKVLKEIQEKLGNAQAEMMNIVKEGRANAERIIAKSTEEAEAIKVQKLAETEREITRMKDEAFLQLRAEVSTLVLNATEKILGRTLDADAHKDLINSAIAEVSKN